MKAFKEIKILILLIIIFGVIYYGVEPLAHKIMNPSIKGPDYSFGDLPKINLANGDASKGQKLVAENCTACHGIKSQKIPAPMDDVTAGSAYGVVPPDLSNVGAVFDANFLANFIKDPVKATLLTHKFNDENPYPMPSFNYLSDDDISNIVAYLKSIAPEKLSDKEVFEQSCDRCHSVSYDKLSALTPESDLKRYLGTNPPDLSMMIRSLGAKELSAFINDPQNILPGTAMPRVGLTEVSEKQIISYLQQVGDSKKTQRDSLGYKIMIFFVVLALLAYAWKRRIWKDLH